MTEGRSERTQDRNERIYALATRLLAASKEDKISWGEQYPTQFYTRLGENFAVIQSVDADDRHPYRFFIEDSQETDLGGISTAETYELEDDWRETLGELYAVAKRKGGRIERALDSMFSELQKAEDDIPF